MGCFLQGNSQGIEDFEDDDDEEDAMLVDLGQQQHEGALLLPAVVDAGGMLLGSGLV